MPAEQTFRLGSGVTLPEVIRARVGAYRDYHRRYCVSDRAMRRLLARKSPGIRFERARHAVGRFVYSHMYPGTYLIVGHGFTGKGGEQRGAYGCRVGRTTVYKKWQWIGPDAMLRPA